jgi:hypothetical protein
LKILFLKESGDDTFIKVASLMRSVSIMKTLRMYVKPGKPVNIDRIRSRLAKRHDMEGSYIAETGSDPLGTYLTFMVPDTVRPGSVQRYRNVVRVLDVTPSDVPSLFKVYPAGGVIDSFDEMWDKFGLELRKSGTERRGWLFKSEKPYMILEGRENVYPEQIAAYPGISKVERVDPNVVHVLATEYRGHTNLYK